MSTALAIEPPTRPRLRQRLRGRAIRVVRVVGSACVWTFGVASLVGGLALLATVPLAQFLSFGYLLEASGRVARTGRIRDGIIGVRRAARVGGLVLGTWLVLWPARAVAGLAARAELIDPGGPIGRRWRIGLAILAGLTGGLIVVACARGGALRHFLWPWGHPLWLVRRLRRRGLYAGCRDATWDFVTCLHLPSYFRLGLVGLLGSFVWLVVPATLMALGGKFPLAAVLGSLILGVVAPSLPLLQARYAAERRFRALFEWRCLRLRFARAPWAFALASSATLLAAVPLYLLKIELVPRDAAWLPALAFVVFLFPARLLCGWAYARSERRELPRHWTFRWLGRLGVLPAVVAYLLIVVLAQFTSWSGLGSFYEQHAFLMPMPFADL